MIGVSKPFDESDTIATGYIVSAQTREPFGCRVGLVLPALYKGIRHGHFARTLVFSTPYVV
jgi:hypothetical protein